MDRNRSRERVLRFLTAGYARLEEAAAGGKVLLDGGDRGVMAADEAELRALMAGGLVAAEGAVLRLTVRDRTRSDALATPARECRPVELVHEGVAETVAVNMAESPLALLWRRKGRDGARFLEAREFTAGERLRRDFTSGQLMPRLGVNWSAAGASGRQGGYGNGISELTDAALGARLRVEKALDDVGPELAGVLVDVCCFLKGLELVEAERGWPARSAKLLLKTALGAMARHYEPAARKPGGRPSILHWGSTDYRPRLG